MQFWVGTVIRGPWSWGRCGGGLNAADQQDPIPCSILTSLVGRVERYIVESNIVASTNLLLADTDVGVQCAAHFPLPR